MPGSDAPYSPSNPRQKWYHDDGKHVTLHLPLDNFTRKPHPGSSYLASGWYGGDLRENHTTDLNGLAPLKKPTNSVRNFDCATITRDAQQTAIIVHTRYPELVQSFLDHKRRHGSTLEKDLYSQPGWTWQRQCARMVEKRPLVFMNSSDLTVTRDGKSLGSADHEWDRVGTKAEGKNQHLFFRDYLSYDEIMLSSLLGVSGPTYFINEGSRNNRARPGQPGFFEERGVIVGLVGARFERPGKMDSLFCLPSDEGGSGNQDPRLTGIFRDWIHAAGGGANINHGSPKEDKFYKFYKDMYRARMRITVDMLLLEADERAKFAQKKAYIHVVGLGLGVWALHHVPQEEYYIETFTSALKELGNSQLRHIDTIDFSYIKVNSQAIMQGVIDAGAERKIRVNFSQRNPADKIMGHAAPGLLLVVSYAWDGNSFPGNEYWMGMLTASGDPAAACFSTISELHNPLTNPGFLRRIKVLGASAQDG